MLAQRRSRWAVSWVACVEGARVKGKGLKSQVNQQKQWKTKTSFFKTKRKTNFLSFEEVKHHLREAVERYSAIGCFNS